MYTAQQLYGLPYPTGGGPASAPTEHMATHELGRGGMRALVNPDNPLVWFGAFLAVTLGLVGVAGSARVGKVRVEAKAGDA